MPEAPELVSDVVAGVGTAANVAAEVVALAGAAMPFSGGANL